MGETVTRDTCQHLPWSRVTRPVTRLHVMSCSFPSSSSAIPTLTVGMFSSQSSVQSVQNVQSVQSSETCVLKHQHVSSTCVHKHQQSSETCVLKHQGPRAKYSQKKVLQ